MIKWNSHLTQCPDLMLKIKDAQYVYVTKKEQNKLFSFLNINTCHGLTCHSTFTASKRVAFNSKHHKFAFKFQVLMILMTFCLLLK